MAVLYLENHLAPAVYARAHCGAAGARRRRRCRSRTAACIVSLELREAKIRRLVDANIVGVAITRSTAKSSTRTTLASKLWDIRVRTCERDGSVARADPA